ncbi:winged helix-turn-helix transcriptional regulator [Paenibacillus sp. GCM10023248]|uniref:winged helix-turn-helix transcriptional regulator n=1 Tax=Bacillales TaxID=1385 RepID=UPI002377EFF9|nr:MULTISPECIES: winged helix-turn-helix transcriptional regulator [Bacillales]MDD9269330.1 winged helix-turn-helix transcriptional regulator [Paenibacillus sp. MAHUQ-63]MDR6880443.1 DNA-binding HxlR family transcriptional regulator [Bacillus sp. 3255]
MSRINKDGFNEECKKDHREIYGIAYTQNLLSGRWKYLILWFLKFKPHRYNEIKTLLWGISQGSLTKQLRELEADGLINRKVYPEVPPRVEYSLTSKGEQLIPIIDLMEEFGKKFGDKLD